jgi:glyoxylase-like metal-dependent hydrolase (beta-lactamase superfamily II)
MLKLSGILFVTLSAAPAFAQMDLAGYWQNLVHEDQPWRGPGPSVGEYTGLPISDAGRMKAESWDATVYATPERQCIPLAADIITIGNVRIWSDVDQATQDVIAWHTHQEWEAQERTIWMDGRSHPPEYAAHTWQGFSTGNWDGQILDVTTTHLKMAQVERNGVPRSDKAVLIEHYIRHDDVLTIVEVIYDPVYLAEPFVRTRDFRWNPGQVMGGYSCRPTVEVPNRARGYVPHHLPGQNAFLFEFAPKYGIPNVAWRGGPDTMYPEFRETMKNVSAGRPRPVVARPAITLPSVPAENGVAGEIQVLPVQGDVYMLVGAGANITVQTGGDSVLVVDTGKAGMSGRVLSAVRRLSNKPIRYVLNTNFDPDHTGGNADIAKAGNFVGGNNGDGAALFAKSMGAAIIANEGVLLRMSAPTGEKSSTPFEAWPTETYAVNEYEVFNGEAVQLFHEQAAHTDGDSVVFFRRSDVISAGDVFSTETWPVIERQNGGSVNGVIAALNHILDIAIPKATQEGGTYIIPGHGRLCDEADALEYRDMVTIIRDRIEDMVRKGLTLDQVKAARPTTDYEARYGATTGPWTTDMFIDAVYQDVRAQNVTAR